MKILFYDTETSGLPDFSAPSEAPHQPHIVQLAALLVDADTRRVLASVDLVAQPVGWTIPAEVAAVHGITTERAMDLGVPEDRIVQMVEDLYARSDLRVGHNESFDARIVRIGMKRFGYGDQRADAWKDGRAECTARLATPICALPPTAKMVAARRFHHKTPNLGEAFQHFFGRPLEEAHSALADVRGCMDVYFAIKDRAAVAA